jgi:uncharacterized protein
MRALLDVNVLIALQDRDHLHHLLAAQWLEANIAHGWASCPLTQNGCLRIMSHGSYSGGFSLAEVLGALRQSCQSQFHAFWGDDISALDASVFAHDYMHSASQLTDLYLLALAVQRGGRLVSFDRRIPLSAVRGAEAQHLLVL